MYLPFLLLSKRAAMRILLRRYRRMGYNQKHVVLVGDGPMAETYLKRVTTDRNLGFQVDGYVSDSLTWKDLANLGRYDQLEQVLDSLVPDEVVVAVRAADEAWLPRIIAACEKTGTKASVIPFYAAYIPSNPQVTRRGCPGSLPPAKKPAPRHPSSRSTRPTSPPTPRWTTSTACP